MKDYIALFNDLPNTEFKAIDVNIASSTLAAMIRRGLLEKVNSTSPYIYKKVTEQVKIVTISAIYNNYKIADTPEYITVYFENRELPILCTYKNMAIYDCYNKLCDITKVTKIEVYNEGKCQTFLI